jgi:hypothetical protein
MALFMAIKAGARGRAATGPQTSDLRTQSDKEEGDIPGTGKGGMRRSKQRSPVIVVPPFLPVLRAGAAATAARVAGPLANFSTVVSSTL